MIDTTNLGKYLTVNERKDIIMRALHTQPYFYKMAFPLVAGVAKETQYSANIGVGRDFYLTEAQGNFGEVFENSGSFFDVSLTTGYNRSLYNFDSSRKIPSGFLLTEARFRVPVANQLFDDRQFEGFPCLIRNNDKVYAEIRNTIAKTENAEAIIVLKGFQTIDNVYIAEREQQQLNASLDIDTTWQFFDIEVDFDGKQSFVMENDKFPRLILGFGAVNTTATKVNVSESNISIRDLSRRLNLTDVAIPLEFIAPRLTCLQDTHMYYLPTEYYWQPLAQLEFNIENIQTETPSGYKLAILTRTV